MSYEYRVVNCKTQEEWDIVTEKLKYNWGYEIKHSQYNISTCINIDVMGYSKLDFYQNQNSLIYSFEEWCNLIDINKNRSNIKRNYNYLISLLKKLGIK